MESVERAIGTGAQNLQNGFEAITRHILDKVKEGEEESEHFTNDDEDVDNDYCQAINTLSRPSINDAYLLDDDSIWLQCLSHLSHIFIILFKLYNMLYYCYF